MTKQMMLLANGKVGMALEGGYDLQAICDSTEMCLRALLGEEVCQFSKSHDRLVERVQSVFVCLTFNFADMLRVNSCQH